MPRSLPLLLLLASSTLAWDHFQYDITLFCNYADRETYNLRIEWGEVDVWPKNHKDKITLPKTLQPTTGRFSFTMEGAMNYDEIWSGGYTSRAFISHDCTDDRKRVDYTLTLTTQCEVGKTCHYRVIRDITNNWGKFEEAANDFKNDMTPFADFP